MPGCPTISDVKSVRFNCPTVSRNKPDCYPIGMPGCPTISDVKSVRFTIRIRFECLNVLLMAGLKPIDGATVEQVELGTQ